MNGELTESRFDPMTFGFDTMLNYQLSQKLKLIKRCKFNHLIISLTFFRCFSAICSNFGHFRLPFKVLCHPSSSSTLPRANAGQCPLSPPLQSLLFFLVMFLVLFVLNKYCFGSRRNRSSLLKNRSVLFLLSSCGG
jgi:hypothetical protein